MGIEGIVLGSFHEDIQNNTKKFFLIIAAYGIVQVLAQDLGVKTGKKQNQLVHKLPIQFLILFSGAFIVTDNYLLALITVGIYYYLKYIYSEGKTSKVCFEDV